MNSFHPSIYITVQTILGVETTYEVNISRILYISVLRVQHRHVRKTVFQRFMQLTLLPLAFFSHDASAGFVATSPNTKIPSSRTVIAVVTTVDCGPNELAPPPKLNPPAPMLELKAETGNHQN